MSMMEEAVIWVRWFNFTMYFASFIVLVYKYVLSRVLNEKHEHNWVHLTLAVHILWGVFSISEILYNGSDWGWRTYGTILIGIGTLFVCIKYVKVDNGESAGTFV